MLKIISKSLMCLLLLIIILSKCVPLSACNGVCDCSEIASVSFEVVRSTITADTLVNLMKADADTVLIECRSPLQKSNIKIPGAKIVYENMSAEELRNNLPEKISLIIIYPGVEGADVASAMKTIREMGYESILEYPDGIYGWITYGYETAGENKK